MSEQSKHAIETTGEQIAPIADAALVVLAEQADKRVDAMVKIKRTALKLTNRHDWVDENGKPYLQASGAEKVARLFGISWRISEPTIENLEEGHWLVTYTGEFSLGGASIDAVGTRSSKDGFFKQYRYEGQGENRKKFELPPSEIDRGDVKKAAYTNLLGNGITRLLGIRNLTYEDLQECAGIKREDITTVTFKKDGKPPQQGKAPAQQGKAPAPQAKSEDSKPGTADAPAPATEPQQRAIHAILVSLNIEDELAKHQKVATILGLKTVPTSMGKLTSAEASRVIQALQAQIDEVRNGQG